MSTSISSTTKRRKTKKSRRERERVILKQFDNDLETTTPEHWGEAMEKVPDLSQFLIQLDLASASTSNSSQLQENGLPNLSNGTWSTLMTFHVFKKLPPELRHRIWELVDQIPPRLVVIPQQPQVYPAITQVCSESRAVAFRGYVRFEDPECHNDNAPAIWLHPHRDTLYMRTSLLRRPYYQEISGSNLADVVFLELSLYLKLLSSARNVAIPVRCRELLQSTFGAATRLGWLGEGVPKCQIGENVEFWKMIAQFCPEVQFLFMITGNWVDARFYKGIVQSPRGEYLYNRLVKSKQVARDAEAFLELSDFWGADQQGSRKSVTATWILGRYPSLDFSVPSLMIPHGQSLQYHN
ncbi:hypothetical protein HYALB_00003660 [Hymenoscyphus albidus]|uniref:2EXR domain-containing protein n=1 Tax=Hymenoscyphus albidus TaxID=595503 RepID=A0A9N9LJV8_9HELO|nr:hypothetical protein HYALB_00003660 [Hymenoscyphus albidus]